MPEFLKDLFSNPLPWLIAVLATGIWVGKVNERTSSISSVITDIRNDLQAILRKIDRLLDRADGAVTRGSPLQLTKAGRSISEVLGAAAWAEAKARELGDQVQGMRPYDVQEFAERYVEEFKPDPGMESTIRACAYEHGLPRSEVLQVLIVELRDQLLALLPATLQTHTEGRSDGRT